jgi:hypothetical protein
VRRGGGGSKTFKPLAVCGGHPFSAHRFHLCTSSPPFWGLGVGASVLGHLLTPTITYIFRQSRTAHGSHLIPNGQGCSVQRALSTEAIDAYIF